MRWWPQQSTVWALVAAILAAFLASCYYNFSDNDINNINDSSAQQLQGSKALLQLASGLRSIVAAREESLSTTQPFKVALGYNTNLDLLVDAVQLFETMSLDKLNTTYPHSVIASKR